MVNGGRYQTITALHPSLLRVLYIHVYGASYHFNQYYRGLQMKGVLSLVKRLSTAS